MRIKILISDAYFYNAMYAVSDLLKREVFTLNSDQVQGDRANFNRLELRLVDWQELCDPRYDVIVELVDPVGRRRVFMAYSFNDQKRIRVEHGKIRDALQAGHYLVRDIGEEQFQLDAW